MPMPTHRNVDYSLTSVIFALLLICGLTIAGPLLIDPALNNRAKRLALQEFEAAFREVQHPAGTETLASRTVVGGVSGGGEGCNFYLGELRTYERAEAMVLETYAGQDVNGYRLRVAFLDSDQIQMLTGNALPEQLGDFAAWELPPEAERQVLYMVYVAILDYQGDQTINCQ